MIEVGAGTGGTTAAVVADLPPDRTMYTFTDVSDFFLARAGERFARHSFLQYSRLDIEQTPSDQGYVAGTYDIVIAANVLHATRHLDRTLANVRSLLAPGGLLIAYEGTRHPRWFDITTGLIEGWQLFEDDWRTDQPLLPVDEWTSALLAAGFVETVALPRAEAPTAILGQHVFLAPWARRVDLGPLRRGPTGRYARSIAPAAQISAPDGASISTALADALPDEREDLLVGFVREAIAYVLRVGDASRLRRDQPLIDLGFDSLMAVELRNVLREGLGLERKLPATLVFDHPSILAIASHLDTVMFADRRELGRGADPAGDSNRFHAAVGRDSRGATDLTDFTEDEVEAMLMQKLSEIKER